LGTTRENASSATRSRCECVAVDCLPVPCVEERRRSRPAIAGRESRAQSSERARRSPLEIAAIGPGAKLRRAKRGTSETRKDPAQAHRRRELVIGLLQSAT